MATNRTPLEAITYAKRFVKNFKIDDEDLKIHVLNAASNRLHTFAPWVWAVAQTTIGTPELSNGTATVSYTPTNPVTFDGILWAELLHTTDNRVDSLTAVAALPSQDRHSGTPRLIAAEPANTRFRLYPIPQYDIDDLPDLQVFHRLLNYEIVETGATGRQANDDSATGLLFPDTWFWVYEELVLLYAMRFADDPKAGSVNISNNSNGTVTEFTGQQAVCREALLYMASKEELLFKGLGEVANG